MAARGDFPFAQCNCQKLVLGRRCDRASAMSGRGGSGGMVGAWVQKAFARPILLPRQGEPVGSGFRMPETPSKAAGPRVPGHPAPLCPLESRGPGAKKASVAFLSRGALGLLIAARGDFPFAQCSCQKLLLGRRCEGASAMSGRAGSGGMAGAWTQKAFARPILLPRQGEPVGSGFRVPETPSKSAGPRVPGHPAPLCPLESGGPGAKTACDAFLSRGALGLLIAARGDFPFAECSFQKLVLGRRCDGASALSGRASLGGMAAAWAQKAFACTILLPRQGEPVGSGFRAPETPSKAAGPREPRAAPPRFALWRAEGRGRKRLVLLS